MTHIAYDIIDIGSKIRVDTKGATVEAEVVSITSDFLTVKHMGKSFDVLKEYVSLYGDGELVYRFPVDTGNNAPESYFGEMSGVKFQVVYDLSKDIGELNDYFGSYRSMEILSKCYEIINQFNDEGCQDSFRLRLVALDGERFQNEEAIIEAYNSLKTCCGSYDIMLEINGATFEFGLNYGH